MINVVNPKIANGRTMFINKDSGTPVISRKGGVVSVRPGLGSITFYVAQRIKDVGMLIMMSDGKASRFYLFTGMYRGTVTSEHHCVSVSDARDVLMDVLEEPRTQGIGDFKRRIWNWLVSEVNN
ncbi:hypothetical protein D3C79_48920 [compost metagenome]